MSTKFNALLWRVMFVSMTLAVWVNLTIAQEDVEVVEEAANFGPIWAILLAGLVAIAALGFLMNSSGSSNDSDNQ